MEFKIFFLLAFVVPAAVLTKELDCPDNGKHKYKIGFPIFIYFLRISLSNTVTEWNVTTWLDTLPMNNCNRPVKKLTTVVHVYLNFFLKSIIKVASLSHFLLPIN